jgi:hypothetical protein
MGEALAFTSISQHCGTNFGGILGEQLVKVKIWDFGRFGGLFDTEDSSDCA